MLPNHELHVCVGVAGAPSTLIHSFLTLGTIPHPSFTLRLLTVAVHPPAQVSHVTEADPHQRTVRGAETLPLTNIYVIWCPLRDTRVGMVPPPPPLSQSVYF